MNQLKMKSMLPIVSLINIAPKYIKLLVVLSLILATGVSNTIHAQDTDGDGVVDSVDLDDDNDGILDVNEKTIINVSLNKTVVDFSSQYNTGTWAASNINDGVVNSSNHGWASVQNAIPAYVTIDLGADTDFDKMIIQAEDRFNNRNAKDYILYGSSTGAFSGEEFVISSGTIPSLLILQTHEINFTPTTARFVKIEVLTSYSTYAIIGELSLFSSFFDGDTDSDGILNRLDLDSDNDGCDDVVESGGTDATADGILDGTGFDANGLVTGGTGGYDGANGNEIIATEVTITTAPTNQTVITGSPAGFSITANATSTTAFTGTAPNTTPDYTDPSATDVSASINYQWYLGDPDSGGTALTNTGVYSGVTTATLIIGNSTGLYGNEYYVVTSHDDNVCIREVNSALLIDPCDSVASGNTDTDNDGISDVCDLDDDNDGILDVDEYLCVLPIGTTPGILPDIRWDVNSFPFPGNVEANFIPTNITSGSIVSFGTGLNASKPSDPLWLIQNVDASTLSESIINEEYLEVSITTSNVTDVLLIANQWLTYHNSVPQTSPPDKVAIVMASDSGFSDALTIYDSTFASLVTGWVKYDFDPSMQILLLPNTTYYFRVYFYGTASFFRVDAFGLSFFCATDFDADGLSNHLDLDSDADGCPDAVEGAGTFTEYDLVTSTLDGGSSGVVTNLGTTVDTDGIPTNSGSPQATTSAVTDILDSDACKADLSLSKGVQQGGMDVGSVNIGSTISFIVSITNDGPHPVTNVEVTDTLPAGLTGISAVTTTGTFNSGTGLWDLASHVLAVGDLETITITATVGTDCTDLTNTAEITAMDREDTDSTPNNGQ